MSPRAILLKGCSWIQMERALEILLFSHASPVPSQVAESDKTKRSMCTRSFCCCSCFCDLRSMQVHLPNVFLAYYAVVALLWSWQLQDTTPSRVEDVPRAMARVSVRTVYWLSAGRPLERICEGLRGQQGGHRQGSVGRESAPLGGTHGVR